MPRGAPHEIEFSARRLGAALPPLVVKAERIAATVMLGSMACAAPVPAKASGTTATMALAIPPSASTGAKAPRATPRFIRENEWEAANTLWLWASLGPRMDFKSHLATETKRHHAEVLTLAMAALALRAHERVGLLGSGERASYGRHMLSKLALGLSHGSSNDLPQPNLIQRRSSVLLVSDFLDEPAAIEKSLTALASSGMHGHLVQVTDPAEESLPYDGRMDFIGLDVATRYRATRAEGLRKAYQEAFSAHRNALRDMARKLGWSFNLHRTDQPLAATVLALYQRLAL